ncbi:DUF2953 domain-containing protein [Oceanobacillus timonensis]|uniref:DUF2953 domain-containing protein n=1 Tax=Oceanobacillus timonensis TaxID=1926285 RepID=UPI0009BA24D5|nr:DUF2953 domain-containing protein [Oceanobacillus timonensis]
MNSVYLILILIAGIIFIFAFLLQSKWAIQMHYQFPDKQELQISVFFYKWCVIKKKHLHLPEADQIEMGKGYMDYYKLLRKGKLHLLKELRLPALLKEFKVLEFKWLTRGGTGNAFTTSVFSGTIWALKGWLIGYLGQHLEFSKNPQIQVQPDFKNSSLETRFSCMISFRLGKTILGIIRALKMKEVRK